MINRTTVTIVIEVFDFASVNGMLDEAREQISRETREGKLVKADNDTVTWSTIQEEVALVPLRHYRGLPIHPMNAFGCCLTSVCT